jgi:hypothetical protein
LTTIDDDDERRRADRRRSFGIVEEEEDGLVTRKLNRRPRGLERGIPSIPPVC